MNDKQKELLSRFQVIKLSGYINKATLDYFKEAFKKAASENVEKITIEINSPGGEIQPSLQIFDLIANFNGKITGIVLPYASSAAAIILQACHERIAFPGSTILHHHYRAPVWLSNKKISSRKKDLFANDERLCRELAKRSNLSTKKLDKLQNLDLSLSANQALAMGFVDSIKDLTSVKKKRKKLNLEKRTLTGIESNQLTINAIVDDFDDLRLKGSPPVQLTIEGEGNFINGLQIHDILKFYPGHITINAQSRCVNGIPWVLLAGDKRQATQFATLIFEISEIWVGHTQLTDQWGEKLIIEQLECYDKIAKKLWLHHLKPKFKKSKLENGKPINSGEALKMGLIQKIIIPDHLKGKKQ
jgi:ATP-dependent Clp protease protease subunit